MKKSVHFHHIISAGRAVFVGKSSRGNRQLQVAGYCASMNARFTATVTGRIATLCVLGAKWTAHGLHFL